MLSTYSPSNGRQSPDYPFWHLRSDGLWEIPGVKGMPTGTNKPSLTAMRELKGGFPDDVQSFLSAHPAAIQDLARAILSQHFPETLHQDILDEVGMVVSPGRVQAGAAEERAPSHPSRPSILTMMAREQDALAISPTPRIHSLASVS